MKDHAKEPWWCDSGTILAGDKDDPCVVAEAFNADNAHRIVACVNACADTPTDWLENWAAPQVAGTYGPGAPFDLVVAAFWARSFGAEKQRDQLLAALKRVRTAIRKVIRDVPYSEKVVVDPLLEALAEIEPILGKCQLMRE